MRNKSEIIIYTNLITYLSQLCLCLRNCCRCFTKGKKFTSVLQSTHNSQENFLSNFFPHSLSRIAYGEGNGKSFYRLFLTHSAKPKKVHQTKCHKTWHKTRQETWSLFDFSFCFHRKVPTISHLKTDFNLSSHLDLCCSSSLVLLLLQANWSWTQLQFVSSHRLCQHVCRILSSTNLLEFQNPIF